MGRPAHEIWELFTVVVARSREGNMAHPDVKCVFCNTLLANAQPSRNMLRHALQCDELSDDAKVKWKDLARKQRHSIKEKLRTPQKRTPDKGIYSSLNKRLFGTPSSTVVPRDSPLATSSSESKPSSPTFSQSSSDFPTFDQSDLKKTPNRYRYVDKVLYIGKYVVHLHFEFAIAVAVIRKDLLLELLLAIRCRIRERVRDRDEAARRAVAIRPRYRRGQRLVRDRVPRRCGLLVWHKRLFNSLP
ncbi:hypothetical protein FI667_g15810, partial [Globisporangium splendens]